MPYIIKARAYASNADLRAHPHFYYLAAIEIKDKKPFMVGDRDKAKEYPSATAARDAGDLWIGLRERGELDGRDEIPDHYIVGIHIHDADTGKWIQPPPETPAK